MEKLRIKQLKRASIKDHHLRKPWQRKKLVCKNGSRDKS